MSENKDRKRASVPEEGADETEHLESLREELGLGSVGWESSQPGA